MTIDDNFRGKKLEDPKKKKKVKNYELMVHFPELKHQNPPDYHCSRLYESALDDSINYGNHLRNKSNYSGYMDNKNLALDTLLKKEKLSRVHGAKN